MLTHFVGAARNLREPPSEPVCSCLNLPPKLKSLSLLEEVGDEPNKKINHYYVIILLHKTKPVFI